MAGLGRGWTYPPGQAQRPQSQPGIHVQVLFAQLRPSGRALHVRQVVLIREQPTVVGQVVVDGRVGSLGVEDDPGVLLLPDNDGPAEGGDKGLKAEAKSIVP